MSGSGFGAMGLAVASYEWIAAITLVAVMVLITVIRPLPAPVRFQVQSGLDLTPSPFARWGGGLVIVITIMLYVVFW